MKITIKKNKYTKILNFKRRIFTAIDGASNNKFIDLV